MTAAMPRRCPLPEPNEVSFEPLGARPNVLLVWPALPASFWDFRSTFRILPERSLMPPLGLITVAALCPPAWNLRLVDESVRPVREADLAWADLIMVSAMNAQRDRFFALLDWARRLGVRTMVGGPYPSAEPEVMLPRADHVVVGEPDEIFASLAADLERGRAKRLYVVEEKPDLAKTPIPRFDLLDHGRYASMAVQFSRGCPFQCEFCDIITIYGRRPRAKTTRRLIDELDSLHAQGWRGQVFVVDDNFIGNSKLALEMAEEMAVWQGDHGFPFSFFTEASINLAELPALIDAMVRANFLSVFVGIESPSKASLLETKKLQNLRRDPLQSILLLQRSGLWVAGGFIVGFDNDTEEIFELQQAFIEQAAIPWAMTGFLQAPPTTPLYERMAREGRLLENDVTTNFATPNFQTVLPRSLIVGGLAGMLGALYHPKAFYRRAARSLVHWNPRKEQRAPPMRLGYTVKAILRSFWRQGIISRYKSAYWSFLVELCVRWRRDSTKLWWGFGLLLSGEHFIKYAADVTRELEQARSPSRRVSSQGQ
jgi:radical SAM superfamily enzyme YgiQ (UPF0313 family)